MPFSFNQIARYFGDLPSKRAQQPVVTLSQPAQLLRFPGLYYTAPNPAIPGMSLSSGSMGCYTVDPPAGGFAAADELIALPGGLAFDAANIIAPAAPQVSACYAPGIFDINVGYTGAVAFTSAASLMLSLIGVVNGVRQTSLGGSLRSVFIRIVGTGASNPVQLWTFRIRAEYPWQAILLAQTGLTDTMIVTVRIGVQPVVLFDAFGNVY